MNRLTPTASSAWQAGPTSMPALQPTTTPDTGLAWFVVYTKPHKDRTAVFHLERRGVEVFYPRLQLPGYVDVRRRIVPLFPAYLFVRIALERQFQQVVWAPGVSRLIGSEGRPAAVDDAVIEFLQGHAGVDGLIEAQPRVTVGQSVEITHGPFAGIVAIIQRPPNAKGRIRVLMRLLNRGIVRVELPLQHVKTDWTPSDPVSSTSPRTAVGVART